MAIRKLDISGILSRFKVGEKTLIIGMSFIVGLLSGFGNMIFRATMDFVHNVFFVGGISLLSIDEGGFY